MPSSSVKPLSGKVGCELFSLLHRLLPEEQMAISAPALTPEVLLSDHKDYSCLCLACWSPKLPPGRGGKKQDHSLGGEVGAEGS